ncbi:MAG: FxsA family protein [Bacteriovoracaceae bacterium]|nr:FxsA family protein [Bacteriovoracaceae bacterium]
MFLILVLLFTCVPALELYLLFTVGAQIGALNTILIIIATGIVGASLAKSQGLELLFKIQDQLNRGEMPTGQLLQGFLVMGGGLLLLTPGFVTDILGFSMVLPGTRTILAAIIRKTFFKAMQNGMKNGNIHVFTNMGQGFRTNHPGQEHQTHSPEHRVDSDTFEAEYHKKDEDQ